MSIFHAEVTSNELSLMMWNADWSIRVDRKPYTTPIKAIYI